MSKKRSMSFRLSNEAAQMLSALAEKLGISQAAVLEIAIREKVSKENL